MFSATSNRKQTIDLTKKIFVSGSLLLLSAAWLAHAQDPRKAAIKAFFEKGTAKASAARLLGKIDDKHLTESSGLICSKTNSGVLWTHNDSGNPPEIFAINLQGETLARLTVSGANNYDWEAISIGPGSGGKPALYIGDIGDNNFDRTTTAIYRIPEPRVDVKQRKVKADTVLAEKFPYRYPDGAHDCETLLVHPQTGAMALVTKMRDGVSGVYSYPMPLRANQMVTLQKLGTVTFASGFTGRLADAEHLVTDGAFSPDGKHVILRNYLTAYEWDIAPNQSLADALKGKRRQRILPFIGQGESICYRNDGKALYVTSESNKSPLYEVPLTP